MNTWVEAPPRRKGLAVRRGCLTLSIFAIVLAIAGFCRLFGSSPQLGIVLRQYWLAKTGSLAEAPTPIPEFNASDQQFKLSRNAAGFRTENACRQPAEIELSADDVMR